MENKPSSNSRGTKPQAGGSFRSKRGKATRGERELRMKNPREPKAGTENARPHRKRDTNATQIKRDMARHSPLSFVFRHIEPTWRDYILYVRCAAEDGDEVMKKYFGMYERLPKNEQRTIMPERLCELAGVPEGELVGSVSRYFWQHRKGESVLLAAVNQPKMIQATAFWGQTLADCVRDRELFFRFTGALPDRKGSSIVINYGSPTSFGQAQPPTPAGANGFRTMDQRVIEMGKLLDDSEAAFTKDAAIVFEGGGSEED